MQRTRFETAVAQVLHIVSKCSTTEPASPALPRIFKYPLSPLKCKYVHLTIAVDPGRGDESVSQGNKSGGDRGRGRGAGSVRAVDLYLGVRAQGEHVLLLCEQ